MAKTWTRRIIIYLAVVTGILLFSLLSFKIWLSEFQAEEEPEQDDKGNYIPSFDSFVPSDLGSNPMRFRGSIFHTFSFLG